MKLYQCYIFFSFSFPLCLLDCRREMSGVAVRCGFQFTSDIRAAVKVLTGLSGVSVIASSGTISRLPYAFNTQCTRIRCASLSYSAPKAWARITSLYYNSNWRARLGGYKRLSLALPGQKIRREFRPERLVFVFVFLFLLS